MKSSSLIAYRLLKINLLFRVLAPGLGLIWAAGAILCLLMPATWIATEGLLLVVAWLLFKLLGLASAYLAVDTFCSLALYRRHH